MKHRFYFDVHSLVENCTYIVCTSLCYHYIKKILISSIVFKIWSWLYQDRWDSILGRIKKKWFDWWNCLSVGDLLAILSRFAFRETTGGRPHGVPAKQPRRRLRNARQDNAASTSVGGQRRLARLVWPACLLPACLPPRRRRRRCRPGAIIRSSLIKLCEMSKDLAMPGKTDNADADYYIPRRPMMVRHPRLLDHQGNCVYEYNFARGYAHIHIYIYMYIYAYSVMARNILHLSMLTLMQVYFSAYTQHTRITII